MNGFDKYLRAIFERAGREAQADCSSTIEAQHILLAMTAQPETAPGQFLNSVGLDHHAMRAALEREFEHSLSTAGVSVQGFNLQRSKSATDPAGQLGTSVRHALERGLSGIRTPPSPAHVLLGILQAEIGIVPRALALAGYDRVDLMARLRQTFARE
jgi:ATP-dependent Clp protease ATP-binding subunit ClpA